MKISKDINGSKILKIESSDFYKGRGFSIQTNGNLLFSHSLPLGTDLNNESLWVVSNVDKEVLAYIRKYGTVIQKRKIFGSLKNNK